MIEVTNTYEMAQVLSDPAQNLVKVPANANMLLSDAAIPADTISELESVARRAGRYLHMR